MKTFFEFLASLNENLVLKKRPVEDGKFQFVVDSDIQDKKLAGNETYKNKEKIRALGFTWDKNLQKWVSPETYDSLEFSAIMPELRKKLLSLNSDFDEKSVGELSEDLEDYLELGLIDKLKETFNELKKKIIETQNSPEIRDFLRFSAKFTKRSFNNKILIWIQNRNATHVEGMRTWREQFGRRVKKGAKAIKIWVPYQKKEKGSSQEEDAPRVDQNVDETKQLTRFRIGHVFDIADTEPIPGKENMYVQEPKWFDDSNPDEHTRYIYDALLEFAKEHNIKVEINSEGLDGARGVSRKGSIQLMQENIPVMIHELAHEILHTTERRKDLERARLEFEAEGVNYLVCSHYGLPNKQGEIYLALWLKEDKEGKKRVDEFFNMIQKNEDVIKTAEMFVKYINEKAMESKSQEETNSNEVENKNESISWFLN